MTLFCSTRSIRRHGGHSRARLLSHGQAGSYRLSFGLVPVNAPAVTNQSLEGSRLGLIVSNRPDLDNFWFANHPENNQVVSGTEFPSARQHAIVLSAIPSQVLPTGLHISGVPIVSVPVFVAYQVSEMSRSSNLMLRVSRIPPHLCLTPSSPLEACLVIENSRKIRPKGASSDTTPSP